LCCVRLCILIKRRACHCFCSQPAAENKRADSSPKTLRRSNDIKSRRSAAHLFELNALVYRFFMMGAREQEIQTRTARIEDVIDLMRLPTRRDVCAALHVLCKQSIKSSTNRRLISLGAALKRSETRRQSCNR